MTGAPDLEEVLQVRAWPGALDSRFLLRVWWQHPLAAAGDPAAPALAIVTDTDDNHGPSVTNAAEAVLTAVEKRTRRRQGRGFAPGRELVVVVEHYPPRGILPSRCAEVAWDTRNRARWLPVSQALLEVAASIDLPPTERDEARRLLSQLDDGDHDPQACANADGCACSCKACP